MTASRSSTWIEVSVDVHVTLRADIKSKENPIKLKVPAGSTVGQALAQLGFTENQPWNAALRGRLASDQDVLQDGDRLMVFEPIGGG